MSDLSVHQSSVPSYTCIVYVKSDASGVQARVANLEGIQTVAPSEREALQRVVPEFKRKIAAWVTEKVDIPWIEPPVAKDSDEQTRLVPVHL